jgi:hydroxymethylpyrimidine/phosphomethylpyrimidine kinase
MPSPHPEIHRLLTALTIAGSDSGGGAGVQADLRVFAVLGVHGSSAVTALTAQNTLGVRGVLETPPDFVRAQIDAVMEDIGADAVKTGMLSSSAIVETVADAIKRHRIRNLVVDPVMVAKGGGRLLRDDAVQALREKLLPLAKIATPNTEEALVLTGMSRISNRDELEEAARRIHALGPAAVLLKGGHLGGETSDDLWFDGKNFETLPGIRHDNRHTHGTGCTLSAAIAAWLARGAEPFEACQKAKDYVAEAIRSARPLGRGVGPVNHLWPWEKMDYLGKVY